MKNPETFEQMAGRVACQVAGMQLTGESRAFAIRYAQALRGEIATRALDGQETDVQRLQSAVGEWRQRCQALEVSIEQGSVHVISGQKIIDRLTRKTTSLETEIAHLTNLLNRVAVIAKGHQGFELKSIDNLVRGYR